MSVVVVLVFAALETSLLIETESLAPTTFVRNALRESEPVSGYAVTAIVVIRYDILRFEPIDIPTEVVP